VVLGIDLPKASLKISLKIGIFAFLRRIRKVDADPEMLNFLNNPIQIHANPASSNRNPF
jgi:hypothetical protein